MEVYVCSDDARLRKIFAKAASAKSVKLHYPAAIEAAALAGRTAGPALFFIDLGSFTEKSFGALRAALEKNERTRYAVLDPDGEAEDVAALLKEGALDYLGPKLCRTGVTPARLGRALAALERATPARGGHRRGGSAAPEPSPTADWKSVRPGREYLFHMLYIELDGHRDTGLRSAESTVGRLIAYFQKAVGRFVAAERGRLWIWTDFSGIVLFPSAVSADAVTAACLRLMLSRRLVSVDQDIQKLLFSYRMVLIDGSTVFRERGQTGTIISDAVNSLSHLGARFAKPGNFYLAASLHDRLAPGLRKCFVPAGAFEGTPLLKMKLPARY